MSNSEKEINLEQENASIDSPGEDSDSDSKEDDNDEIVLNEDEPENEKINIMETYNSNNDPLDHLPYKHNHNIKSINPPRDPTPKANTNLNTISNIDNNPITYRTNKNEISEFNNINLNRNSFNNKNNINRKTNKSIPNANVNLKNDAKKSTVKKDGIQKNKFYSSTNMKSNNPVSKFNKFQKSPMLTNNYPRLQINTLSNNNLKKRINPINFQIMRKSESVYHPSIFSTISENLFQKLLKDDRKGIKDLKTYDNLVQENSITYERNKRDKTNIYKFNNMMSRQKEYEIKKINKMKTKKLKLQSDFRNKYTWNPNGVTYSNKSTKQFYKEQQKFLETKKDKINKLIKKEKEKINRELKGTLISNKSKVIINKVRPNETLRQSIIRLNNEKLQKEKKSFTVNSNSIVVNKSNSKTRSKNNNYSYLNEESKKSYLKKSQKEIKEHAYKLYNDNYILKRNKENKINQHYNSLKAISNSELITTTTKKILIQKFMKLYEKVIYELFNKNGNFLINYEEYKNLLVNCNIININHGEQFDLCYESFYKFLLGVNPERYNNSINNSNSRNKVDKIESYSFVLFILSLFNIYKGYDEACEKTIQAKSKSSKKPNTKPSEELVKTYVPDIDLNKIKFSSKQVKLINKKFSVFCTNITNYWNRMSVEKRKEKNIKINEVIQLEQGYVRDNSRKNNLKVENSRKRMFEKAKEVLINLSDLENQSKTIKSTYSTNTLNHNSKKKLKMNNNTTYTSNTNSITKSNRKSSDKKSISNLKLEDVYLILQKKKEKILENKRLLKEKEKFKECTFQPNKNTRPVNSKNINSNIMKLYNDGKVSYIKKRREKEPVKELDLQCTFKPSIIAVNETIFENNPLENDQLVMNHIDRITKAREQKIKHDKMSKLRPYLNNSNSNCNTNSNQNINGFNYTQPGMRFDLELKSNIRSFKNFDDMSYNFKNYTFNNESGRNFYNNGEEYDGYENYDRQERDNSENIPLLKVEVNIDDSNKVVKLEIFPGDVPEKITEDFCERYNLGEEKKQRLLQIIQEKIREASNNENYNYEYNNNN